MRRSTSATSGASTRTKSSTPSPFDETRDDEQARALERLRRGAQVGGMVVGGDHADHARRCFHGVRASRPGRMAPRCPIGRTAQAAPPPPIGRARRRAARPRGYDRYMSRFSVIVADDHPLFREGVVRAVRGLARARAASPRSATGARRSSRSASCSPDVACVDLRLPEIDGIGIANAVTRDGLATRVLLLSAFADDELVYRALEAGAAGYLTKDATQEEIARAIHGVGERPHAARAGARRRAREPDPRALARRHAAPHRARAAGARAALRGALGAADRAAPVPRHDDGQVAPRPAVREARRLRSRGRRRRGDAPRHRGVNEPRLPDAERLTALLRIVAVPVLLVGEVYVPKPRADRGPLPRRAGAVRALRARHARRWPARELAPARALDGRGLRHRVRGRAHLQLGRRLLAAALRVPLPGRRRRLPRAAARDGAVAAASHARSTSLQAAPHPSRSSSGALSFVLVQAAYLAWLGLALALLSLLLARRDAAVRLLSAQRQRLVAEALTAEERERRQLAQDLHDGAIQNLLAARHDLDLPAKADPGGPRGARARDDHRDGGRAARRGRRPPPVPARAGGARGGDRRRTRALAAARAGFALELDLAEGEPGPNDRAVLRCTSELLANVARHARAAHVSVVLRARRRESTACSVRDDGVGFDPAGGHGHACARATSAWPRCASAPRRWAARSRSRARPVREPSPP